MAKAKAKKKAEHEVKVQETWGILELMGHVRLAGRVTEEERFGSKMGRIDIPKPDGKFVTQYFGGASIYRFTVTSEEIARKAAGATEPEPPHPMLLAKPPHPAADPRDDDEDWDDQPF